MDVASRPGAAAGSPPPHRVRTIVRGIWGALGPGVITGAADDDPSGITTYSLAGAQFGTGLLWTALLTWPLMTAVQTMCARIGMVTGRGLMGALRQRFSRQLLAPAAAALLVANTINIGADLSGMADAAETAARRRIPTSASCCSAWRSRGPPSGFATPSDRARAQVAGAGAVRVRHHGGVHPARLARGAARDFRPQPAIGPRRLGDAGGDSRHDDQPLPLLLAGLAGGGGGEGAGPPHPQAAPWRLERRAARPGGRRRRGHVLLQPRHVLHHPDDGVHAPRSRTHPARDVAGGRRGAAAARGEVRHPALQPRPRGHRSPGDSDAQRLRPPTPSPRCSAGGRESTPSSRARRPSTWSWARRWPQVSPWISRT